MTAILLLSAILLTNTVCILANSLQTEFIYRLDNDYPTGKGTFGSIAGVDIDKNDNVMIFHRGSHLWLEYTFDNNDNYRPSKDSPIPEDTVVTIEPKTRQIINSWGANLFFMPHGLSIDPTSEHVWLTDVALHQVFKYTIDGSKEVLKLGTAFVPGNDESHFCKPTSVADTGKYLGEFGQSTEQAMISNPDIPTFNVPHKIIYAKEASMICVADRENGRVQCFRFEPKQSSGSQLWRDSSSSSAILNGAIRTKFSIVNQEFNNLVFSLDYHPIRGGIIAIVSGASRDGDSSKPALGFVYNATTGQLITRFSPGSGKTFGMAHDIAISGDEAQSLFVVDIAPINLWKFSRRQQHASLSNKHIPSKDSINSLNRLPSDGANIATSNSTGSHGFLTYMLLLTVVATVLILVVKSRKFGNNISSKPLSAFGRSSRQRPLNDFSRIPMEDNDDDADSDSDIEEFNINQATAPL